MSKLEKIKKKFRNTFLKKMGDKNSDPETLSEAAVLVDHESVSPLNHCQFEDAKKLVIYDVYKILQESSSRYVIGGVYAAEDPKLYFYCTSVACPGENYLLNVYVCHRNTGNYSIGISKTGKITEEFLEKTYKECILDNDLEYITIKSIQSEKHYYIKTFCFNKSAFDKLQDSILVIPIILRCTSTITIDEKVINQLKRDNNFSVLLNKRETADFQLISSSGKRHEVHKAILAAHSPVLRDYFKNSSDTTFTFDSDDSIIDLVIEFFYTGAIKSLSQQNVMKLQGAASKLELKGLRNITEKYLNMGQSHS